MFLSPDVFPYSGTSFRGPASLYADVEGHKASPIVRFSPNVVNQISCFFLYGGQQPPIFEILVPSKVRWDLGTECVMERVYRFS